MFQLSSARNAALCDEDIAEDDVVLPDMLEFDEEEVLLPDAIMSCSDAETIHYDSAEEEKDEEEEDVLMPDQVDFGSNCCRLNCLDMLGVKKALEEWRRNESTKEEQASAMYRQIKTYVDKGGKLHKQMKLENFNIEVCKAAFSSLWGVGLGRIDALRDHASNGFLEPPKDLRSARVVRGKTSKAHVADLFWQWAYQILSEDLAEGIHFDSKDTDMEKHCNMLFAVGQVALDNDDDEPLDQLVLDIDAGPSCGKSVLQAHHIPKSLPNMVWEEIFAVYDNWVKVTKSDQVAQLIPSHLFLVSQLAHNCQCGEIPKTNHFR